MSECVQYVCMCVQCVYVVYVYVCAVCVCRYVQFVYAVYVCTVCVCMWHVHRCSPETVGSVLPLTLQAPLASL